MKRRQFIQSGVSLLTYLSLPRQSLAKGSAWAYSFHDDSPIAETRESFSSTYNGDNMTRPHDLLWDVDGYLRGRNVDSIVAEELDVAIVGGGVAGLCSAYYLQNKKFALLEQDPRLGGNSKGESFNGSTYSVGAAYLSEPDEGTDLYRLLQNLNLWNEGRRESGEDTTVFFEKNFHRPFWQGASAGQDPQFAKVHRRFVEIAEDGDLDFESAWGRQNDAISAEAWLQNEFGDLHPQIKEYLQLYGWSSFGGSLDELSAHQYLGFITAETGSLIAYPGGNSYILKRMAEQIRQKNAPDSLRSNCIVLRVQSIPGGVEVLYENSFGELKKIHCRHAIMACPKYVAKAILPEFGSTKSRAVQFLPYRAYLVGNLILNQAVQSPSYELYCLEGSMPPSPNPAKPGHRNFSDICFGTWAQEENVQNSVLTLYQGIPYDARQFLTNERTHDKYRDQYLQSVLPVLKALGVSANNIQGLRMTRWGHALPLAGVGLINEGKCQLVSESINGVIHFANQDNWMNPCFETAHQEAQKASSLIS